MAGLLIRRAVLEDAEAAVTVLRRSITELCNADHRNDPSSLARWLRNKTVQHFAQWLVDADNFLIVAALEGEVSGVGCIHRSGEVRLCYVRPDMQRVGAGRALLTELEAQARR